MRTTIRAAAAGSMLAAALVTGAATASAEAPQPGVLEQIADHLRAIGTGSGIPDWHCQFGSSNDPACFLPYYD
ncbi:hypothetical protein BJY24_006827 [Nocardia transvalensis]|uniref:Uncharacterized protein n=1 Tax=Nocardia transvalensis TaxID=37333 RepID=A0A7W9PKQ0_9NOCA|nr:hypothetical protein [Nocardia transvalensis]MBB5917915.1 hypothetical protein [Nocardia transvalensis]